jgi:hypothetical protein
MELFLIQLGLVAIICLEGSLIWFQILFGACVAGTFEKHVMTAYSNESFFMIYNKCSKKTLIHKIVKTIPIINKFNIIIHFISIIFSMEFYIWNKGNIKLLS